MRVYITFKKHHVHVINGIEYNHHRVAMIDAASLEDGTRLAEAHFTEYYDQVYSEENFKWDEDKQQFPRALIRLK